MILFKVSAKMFLEAISDLSCKLPEISRTLLYGIVTVTLGYHKVCAWWVPKMIRGGHKIQRMSSFTLKFLEQNTQRWS